MWVTRLLWALTITSNYTAVPAFPFRLAIGGIKRVRPVCRFYASVKQPNGINRHFGDLNM